MTVDPVRELMKAVGPDIEKMDLVRPGIERAALWAAVRVVKEMLKKQEECKHQYTKKDDYGSVRGPYSYKAKGYDHCPDCAKRLTDA